MMRGVDGLLVIGKGSGEDQLLLMRYFLTEPIFKDGDYMYEELTARGGWLDVLVVRLVQQRLPIFFLIISICQVLFPGKRQGL